MFWYSHSITMFSNVQRTPWYNDTVHVRYEKTSLVCSNVQTTQNALMTPWPKIILSWWTTLKQWSYLYVLVKNLQNYYSKTLNPHCLFSHLRLDISIMVVLKQQSSRLGVIFAGSDVERRQADFTFCVMFQQQRDHLIMTLLQSNGQRSEAILQTQATDRQRLTNKN